MIELRRRMMERMQGGASRLPKEYQHVEYIGINEVGAYINTGIYINKHFEFYIKTRFSYNSLNKDCYPIYLRYDRPSVIRVFGVQSRLLTDNNYLQIHYFGGNATFRELSEDFMNNVIEIRTKLDDQGLLVFANDLYSLVNNMVEIKEYSYPLLLFMAVVDNRPDANWNPVSYIYRFSFDDGNQVKDFIPCYRKSDNIVGMYDIVNDVFYTNAGTGSFIVGPDVN